MKKKLLMTGSAVVAAAVLGLGIYHSDASQTNPALSTSDIKQLVKDQYPGTITEIELEKSNNKAVYEVEIVGDGKEYELTLNAETGEVLKLKEKTYFAKKTDKDDDNQLVVNEKDDDDAKDDDRDASQQEQTNNASKGNQTNSNQQKDNQSSQAHDKTNTEQKQVVINTDEASRIALKEFAGAITSIELDEDDDRLIYEIDIESQNGEAEVEIDAYTGEVIMLEIDIDYDDNGNASNNDDNDDDDNDDDDNNNDNDDNDNNND
ncbi:PepSY domain-containing protein [Lentibacillus saliphilus]|uniref:PepSY domain-containing protein n=1 Tax=Lentibacillus saliphilus TaxID=2737028 RepID=UPI001C2FBE87|nr:PepSY domain-containing protein [Lentibacillus saliphilus]